MTISHHFYPKCYHINMYAMSIHNIIQELQIQTENTQHFLQFLTLLLCIIKSMNENKSNEKTLSLRLQRYFHINHVPLKSSFQFYIPFIDLHLITFREYFMNIIPDNKISEFLIHFDPLYNNLMHDFQNLNSTSSLSTEQELISP